MTTSKRAMTALAGMLMALLFAVGGAQTAQAAGTAPAAEAGGTTTVLPMRQGAGSGPGIMEANYDSCPSGYACVYSSWGEFLDDTPEHRYYYYGTYQFSNEYGDHWIWNNQTGGAMVHLCRNYNGTNCDVHLSQFQYKRVNLTPYNSIKLTSS